MHAHDASATQVRRRPWSKSAVRKYLGILIFLIVFMTWVTGSSPTLSAESPLQAGSSVQFGGAYVLTLQPVLSTASGGYLLLVTAPEADPAPGCCCKVCLPSILK